MHLRENFIVCASGEEFMFVKSKKKVDVKDSSPEDTVQSLRSWIRKIEQSTASVSSRLTAVETRLSGSMSESGAVNLVSMQGPIETFVRNGKKKNAGELAHALDSELTILHNEMVNREQDFLDLKNQLTVIRENHTDLGREVRSLHSLLSQFDEKVRLRFQRLERREPLVMRLGTTEIPIEFTGIIGGALVFLIAILVVFDQKAVLLSPFFLSGVGILLLGSALVKMTRRRSRACLQQAYPLPLAAQSAPVNTTPCEQKDA
jgi:hypothetical protein